MVRSALSIAAALVAGSVVSAADVFPTTPHAAMNFIPFGTGTVAIPDRTCTQHQVLNATLFSTATGGGSAQISRIAFATGVTGAYNGSITIRLGYTDAIPGVTSAGGGLAVPVAGGGGAPNAKGAMTLFYENAAFAQNITSVSPEVFELAFDGTPFVYDPSQGNLLVEIVSANNRNGNIDLTVSRTSGSTEGSRAYADNRFTSSESPSTATRMEFTITPVGGGGCYANCDESTAEPVLNVADFTCFLQRFAAGESYANCDESTAQPVLNVADFTCFLQEFAAGCP